MHCCSLYGVRIPALLEHKNIKGKFKVSSSACDTHCCWGGLGPCPQELCEKKSFSVQNLQHFYHRDGEPQRGEAHRQEMAKLHQESQCCMLCQGRTEHVLESQRHLEMPHLDFFQTLGWCALWLNPVTQFRLGSHTSVF